MDDVRMQVFQMQFLLPPFGDEIDDFYWNTRGMLDAKKRIKYNREYLIR